MININGKEWAILEATDIQEVFSEPDFDESFYFEFKDDRVTTQNLLRKYLLLQILLVDIFLLAYPIIKK